MSTSDGRVKIVDFGLARRSDALIADATTLGSIAPDGALAGTPYAMAPENASTRPLGRRGTFDASARQPSPYGTIFATS